MSRVIEKVTPGSMGGGWKRARPLDGEGNCAPASETPGRSAHAYRAEAPRLPPTLLRWGNSARQFSWIDNYVRERLALFDSKKRNKPGRRWGIVHPYAWFKRLGVFTLSKMVRHPRTATAST